MFGTLLLTCALSGQSPSEAPSFRRIELSVLEDKIRGGWAGQMIGVSYGAPTEFQYLGKLVPEDDLPLWSPERIADALEQDDLYVDITFAQVLIEYGLDATTESFGAVFRETRFPLWHGNLAARRALVRGVEAASAGTPDHNVHANDIDFQIESDFIGLMTPGLPQASQELCHRVGRIMASGDGLYGGMFVSGMYSAAFFTSDPRRIVEAGLALLPASSPYAQTISDVLSWSEEFPDDWTHVWRLIEQRWGRQDSCPEGALRPFNIDAKINGAYVALGLLYGRGDFETTIRIATRAGQDSDCNPATAAGVLGVVLGYDGIPAEFTHAIESIADETFRNTRSTFNSITADTFHQAIAMVERHGGRRTKEALTVRAQPPLPAESALWVDYGSPVERVPVSDSRWQFRGLWQDRTVEKWSQPFSSWVGADTEAEALVRFTGTGAIVVGWYLPTGGLADIYLDGTWSTTVDAYPDEDDFKFHESLWHAFGLEDREHEIRLVVRGEPHAESHGTEISLTDLLVFR